MLVMKKSEVQTGETSLVLGMYLMEYGECDDGSADVGVLMLMMRMMVR